MKAYKREDFIKLPAMTIYSRIFERWGGLMDGLYCKLSGEDYIHDWVEQDLIGEAGFPNGIKNGSDAVDYQVNLRDAFQHFETDLDCAGRDGLYNDDDVFVVWDKNDITKLRDYLNNALQSIKE